MRGNVKRFQPRRQPQERKRPRAIHPGNQPHVAVNGQHVGKAGENGADGAIAFRALAVDDVRLDFVQFFPRRADAALIKRAQPADFRHGKAWYQMLSASFSGERGAVVVRRR